MKINRIQFFYLAISLRIDVKEAFSDDFDLNRYVWIRGGNISFQFFAGVIANLFGKIVYLSCIL